MSEKDRVNVIGLHQEISSLKSYIMGIESEYNSIIHQDMLGVHGVRSYLDNLVREHKKATRLAKKKENQLRRIYQKYN